jgi:hypothetical protein
MAFLARLNGDTSSQTSGIIMIEKLINILKENVNVPIMRKLKLQIIHNIAL